MAHIEKRDRGRRPYRVRYRGPDGRERSRSFTRKADAAKFSAIIQADIVHGMWTDPRLGRTMFADWAERWLATVSHLKPKTLLGYRSLLSCHVLPRFGRLPLDRIEPLEVREWVAELRRNGLSTSRTRQSYRLLSASLKAAVESGYLARTPCVGVKLPKTPRREMRFLNAREVERLAETVPLRYSTLVLLLAYGGLRWGEAAALRRGDCELLRSRIKVCRSVAEVAGRLHFGPTKTYQIRTIAIPAFLRDLLSTHFSEYVGPEPDAIVFTGPMQISLAP